MNTTGHTRVLRSFSKNIFNASFFGRKLGDECEHTHTQSLHFWVLSVLLRFLDFYFCRKKKQKNTHTHMWDQSTEETNTITVAHLGGSMAALKSLGSGGVVMPPIATKPRSLYVKVIAQLISDTEIHRNVYSSAAGGVKPLCCNLTLASPSNGVSLERLWSQRAVYALIMLFQTLCGLTRAFHMCYLCNY